MGRLLGYCIVPNNPSSPEDPNLFWNVLLLRETALQNLVLSASATFVTKNF